MNSTRPRTSAKMATATTSWTILSVNVMSSPPDRRGRGRAGGQGTARPPPAPGPGSYLGQDCSTKLSASAVLSPVIQSVMAFHSEAEPTAAGIRSEPSKLKLFDGSCRIFTDSLSIGLAMLAGSSPVLALSQPPCGVALPFSFAHSGEDRYAWNACTSGRSLNAATNSAPTRMESGLEASIGGSGKA